MSKKTTGENIFDICNITLMILFCLSILFPFIQQITKSLSTPEGIISGRFYLFPKKFSLDGYSIIFRSYMIPQSFLFTIERTLLGTILSLIVSCLTAYPLSKKYLPFKNFWTAIIVFTMFFSGGLIPSFLLVRSLGLMNTIWALVLPGISAPFNIIIIRNFFMTIPDSLEESARIDGASNLFIFYKIILPLSKPVLAVISLWLLVGNWNAWFDGLLYITDSDKTLLQILLRRIRSAAGSAFGAGFRDELIMLE